jgi:hypothetical protein
MLMKVWSGVFSAPTFCAEIFTPEGMETTKERGQLEILAS